MNDLTPEELQQLLATIGDPAQLEDIQNQQAFLDKLRTPREQNGRMVGDRYVADPAGAIADVIVAHKSGQDLNALEAKRADIYKRQAGASQNFLDALGTSREYSPKVERIGGLDAGQQRDMVAPQTSATDAMQAPQIGDGTPMPLSTRPAGKRPNRGMSPENADLLNRLRHPAGVF